MKFTVIQNFSEAVDPEERKLRLHKVSKHLGRHLYHFRKLAIAANKAKEKIKWEPGYEKSQHYRRFDSLTKQLRPHERRITKSRKIIAKFGKKIGSVPRRF